MFDDLVGKKAVLIVSNKSGTAVSIAGYGGETLANGVMKVQGKILSCEENFICIENGSTDILTNFCDIHEEGRNFAWTLKTNKLYVNINNIIFIGV